MSDAWEVSEDDVLLVLGRHHRRHKKSIVKKAQELVEENDDRIENAALAYTDMDDQTSSSLNEIEAILRENGLVGQEVFFPSPV